MNRKIILIIGFLFTITIFFFVSCKDEELSSVSIFQPVNELDPTLITFKFDSFLVEYFRKPYNCRYIYRMQDIATDMAYDVVPASLTKAKQLAVLTKFLWFDVYKDVVGETFLKENGIRILHLIGSPMININGDIVVGQAEAGIKITLLNVNTLDITNTQSMNDKFFHTMHHEYMHVLQSKILTPPSFNEVSQDYYIPSDWSKSALQDAYSLGFVSQYARANATEDFVETISIYIVTNDANWNSILISAKKPLDAYPELPAEYGSTSILFKLDLCRSYLKDSWGVDLDALRREVLKKQIEVTPNKVKELLEKYGIN